MFPKSPCVLCVKAIRYDATALVHIRASMWCIFLCFHGSEHSCFFEVCLPVVNILIQVWLCLNHHECSQDVCGLSCVLWWPEAEGNYHQVTSHYLPSYCPRCDIYYPLLHSSIRFEQCPIGYTWSPQIPPHISWGPSLHYPQWQQLAQWFSGHTAEIRACTHETGASGSGVPDLLDTLTHS